jgi:hypothetical protein
MELCPKFDFNLQQIYNTSLQLREIIYCIVIMMPAINLYSYISGFQNYRLYFYTLDKNYKAE